MSIANIGASLGKIYDSFIEAFKIKEFRKLCGATFFIYNAFMAVSSLTFFVIVYKLFNGDAEATGIWVSLFGCLGALGTTFIVIPVVAWLSKKMGKKKAFMLTQSISILGYIMLYFLFIPGKPWMYIIALPFFSFGLGNLVVWEIEIEKFLFFDIFLTKVVFPAPEGDESIYIPPF